MASMTIWSRHETPTYFRPFPWTIAPNDRVTSQCPSRPQILITFLIVNIIVAVVSILLGNKKLTKKITFGLLGKNPDAKHYRFLWVLPVGFNLAANAINATIMTKTPGYGDLFTVADVVLFYTTRPRITWFLSALLTVPWAGRRDDGRPHWSRNWVSFAYTQGLAELALQAISLYTLITANTHGKQLRDQGIESPKSKTWGNSEMAIAALGWVALFGVSCLLVLFSLCACCGRKGRKDVSGGYGNGDVMDNEGRGARKGGLCGWFEFGWLLVVVIAVALGCNWVFWDGYLREFPEEYCPPKLTVQAAIWVLFAALGIPFGVGF